MVIRHVFLAIAFVLASTNALAVGQTCRDLFRAVYMPKEDSAVEIEIGATPAVVELFDTDDGTIGPVLGQAGVEAIPMELRASLQAYVGEGTDIRSAPWDLLSGQEKIEIIQKAAGLNGQKFYRQRWIPGLRYRSEITLTFSEPTRFLGRDYPAGKHKFLPAVIFGATRIEYMAPTRMKENLGFELHVRGRLSAGENNLTSRSLQRALIGRERGMHEHIVAKPPVPKRAAGRLKSMFKVYLLERNLLGMNSDAVDVFRTADFVRRTTLYFDFKMIENGFAMDVIKGSDGAINFEPTDTADFIKLHTALVARGWGETRKLRSKAGTVGLRTPDYYDGDVWGMEVRYLSPLLDRAVTAADLDTIQKQMIEQTYFMSKEEAGAYLRSLPFKRRRFVSLVGSLLYGIDFVDQLGARGFSDGESALLIRAAIKNDYVKMLVHDWSKDPMVYNNPARVAQIQAAQKVGLQMILKGFSTTDVMKIFIRKSGLSYEIRQTLDNAS